MPDSKDRRPNGSALRMAEEYLAAVAPRKVKPPELAEHLGHSNPAYAARVINKFYGPPGSGDEGGKRGRPRKHAQVAVADTGTGQVPDVLATILGAFGGAVSAEQVAGLLLPVSAPLHNRGRRLVHDLSGQVFEVRDL